MTKIIRIAVGSLIAAGLAFTSAGAAEHKLKATLNSASEVPANTSVLIVASPQVDLQPAEVQKIKQYLQKGGNLLWLIDTDPLHGLQPVAETLGLTLGPGTVVDPDAARFNASPTMAMAASYGRHAITDNFRLNTVFPFARQIGINEKGGEGNWKVARLIDVAARGWVETGKLDGSIQFDKARDVPGPVNIAVALERTVSDRQQRVVVVGNGIAGVTAADHVRRRHPECAIDIVADITAFFERSRRGE